jgi:branched-chain amino acid transport system substrate-binding protein
VSTSRIIVTSSEDVCKPRGWFAQKKKGWWIRLNKQTWVIIAVVAVLAIVLGIALSNRGGKDEILIGVNMELTGDLASFGQSTFNGLSLYIEQANEQGLLDKEIKLIKLDNKSQDAEAAAIATRLISQKVIAMVGPVTSGKTIAAGNVAQEKKVPLLSPTATAESVTQIGEYIFRSCFLDDFQAKAMAEFAYVTLNVRRAAILMNSGDDYSTGLAASFKKYFTALGGQVVLEETFLSSDNEFRTQLTKIKNSSADSIYVPAYYNEDGLIARQAREMGITLPILGVDGWDSEKLIEIAGASALNNIYFTNHYTPADEDPQVQAFVKAYEEKYGTTPDALAALGFEGGAMLVDALKRAESYTPEAVRDALASIKDLKALRARITVGSDRNLLKDAVIVELKDGVQHLRGTVSP